MRKLLLGLMAVLVIGAPIALAHAPAQAATAGGPDTNPRVATHAEQRWIRRHVGVSQRRAERVLDGHGVLLGGMPRGHDRLGAAAKAPAPAQPVAPRPSARRRP